jgi:pyridoxine kinase
VLSQCDAVLSGYLGDAEIGEAVLDALLLVRQENPKALFCCDPVMGDYGCGFFVREGIPAVMREKMVPASDIATPNQFELEALTGIELVDMESAARATAILHAQGVRVVLVTSFHPRALAAGHISMLVSDQGVIHSLETPELPLSPRPNGAGDLTAAVFLARYLQSANAVQALELTADAVYSVLERTLAEGKTELALVSAQDDIASPALRFKALRRPLP